MLSRRPPSNEPEPRRLTSSATLFNVLAAVFFGLTVLVCLGFGFIFALDPFTAAAPATSAPTMTAPASIPTATVEPTATHARPTLPPLPTEITATPMGTPPAIMEALPTATEVIALDTATPTLAASSDTATSTVTPTPTQTLSSGYP